ncbi:MAG: 4-hydroxy-tetrahydrodipicolinate reductase, partial [Rhodospirillaceae bacterium]|nr:4-hydroxy-tetrahydrodipicolinate reductase [Rhodospirillaceae bacterium]
PDAVLKAAAAAFDVTMRDQIAGVSEGEATEALQTYDAILPTLGDRFTGDAIRAAGKVRAKVLGNFGVGYNHIDVAAARAAGIGLATGNFSLTAALLQHFAVIAAAHLPHYTVLEYCKAEKPDVPSGTARELAELMAEVRRPDYALSTGDHIGYPESLGAEIDGVRVHAVRLPGYSAGVEVLFGLQGERLALRHEMGADDSIFVEGSLLAARKVQGFQGLVRGLDKLIFDS